MNTSTDNSSSFSSIKIINSSNSNSSGSSNDNIIINELNTLIDNFKLPMSMAGIGSDSSSSTSSISKSTKSSNKSSNSDSSSNDDNNNVIITLDIINDFFDSLVRLKIISLLDVLSLISLSSTNKLLRREIDHISLYWQGTFQELDPFNTLGEYDYSCYCCQCKIPVIIKACNTYGMGWYKFAELLSTPFATHKAYISRAIISSNRSRSYKIPQFIKLAVDEDDYQEEEDEDRLIWVPCTAEGETLCFCFSCIFHDVNKANKNVVDTNSNFLIESFENITISDEQNAVIVAENKELDKGNEDQEDSRLVIENTVIVDANDELDNDNNHDDNDHDDNDHDGNDDDEEDEEEDDEDDEDNDDDESITINELGFNRFSFPSEPIIHLYGYKEGAEELSKIASRQGFEHYHGQTIALHGEFEFEGHLFLEIRIALKLIGINSKNGKMARIVIKGCESEFCPNGTMMIFNDVVLDNLEICSMRSNEEDGDDFFREERYFSAIDVCGVTNSPKFGRLYMTNTTVNACCGSAIIISDFGRAFIENSILSSKSYGIDMFLGVVSKNHTVVTIKNCDLRKNQWGLSMGKRRVMTASKERQIRSCNLLKENDAGVTLMYNYQDISINPWYDIMNADLSEKGVEADDDVDDDDDDDEEVDSH